MTNAPLRPGTSSDIDHDEPLLVVEDLTVRFPDPGRGGRCRPEPLLLGRAGQDPRHRW
ncbi:hypothetical protein [Nocardioides sp. B-3]|uniref:hypothetical protein n=1 Tax=Nocardioides sp. B-3 TaxID=2895565 RepID=UPI00300E37EE